MKLKDKKIEICEYTYSSDKYGNCLKTLVPEYSDVAEPPNMMK